MKFLFIILSILLLIYMLWPGPTKISQFPSLPDYSKSTLEGDSIQIPNVSAYFSDQYREFVTNFYSKAYQNLSYFPFPPIRLNHPPEYSWIAIKKHTDSTYIEEFVYPLRDSIYVNGLEPIYQDGQPKWWGAIKFKVLGKEYLTKTTLRFYPSPIGIRILVWLGITISIIFMFRLGKRIIGDKV